MDSITYLVDLVLHVDAHLGALITALGPWTYLILFAIVFCETGLIVTPFLPGDSLLFAAGTFAGAALLDLPLLLVTLAAAGILGDAVNYSLGASAGRRILESRLNRFIKQEHLEKTNRFYEKHGGKTIILARFMPIIRTFAPFVAGLGRMAPSRFFLFNVSGGLLWVVLLTGGGYLFGNMPWVQQNFSLVILAIIVLSILPGVIEYLRHRRMAAATEIEPN
ncbi:MAG TPA: DedA family protein [Desulfurivibrionaceae bacterium]|nr:DedA family protein [Desulfurivibrionaceae bacterium]